jgi:hypothetical protein
MFDFLCLCCIGLKIHLICAVLCAFVCVFVFCFAFTCFHHACLCLPPLRGFSAHLRALIFPFDVNWRAAFEQETFIDVPRANMFLDVAFCLPLCGALVFCPEQLVLYFYDFD